MTDERRSVHEELQEEEERRLRAESAQRRRDEEQQREQEEQRQHRPYELFGEVQTQPRESGHEVEGPDDRTESREQVSEMVPTVHQSDYERRQEELQRQEDAPGFIEGVDLATQQEWIGRLWGRGRQKFDPDPEFEWTPDKLQEYADGLPDEALDYIFDAQSADEAQYLREQYEKDLEAEEGLAQMGFTGTALRIGATLSDLAAWGIGVGASAVVGPGGLIGKGVERLNRVQRIVRGGAAGASGNLAVEAAIRENKPIYDDMNLLWGSGLGLAVGGGFSALSRNPSTGTEAEALKRLGRGMQQQAESDARVATERIARGEDPMSVNEDVHMAVKTGKPFASQQAVRNSKRFRETPGAEIVEVDGGFGWRAPRQEGSPSDMGAARVSTQQPISPDDAKIEGFLERVEQDPTVAPYTAYAKGRFDSVALGKSSENPGSRATFNVMAEDGVGNLDRDTPAAFTATQRQIQYQRGNETDWVRNYRTNFRKWAEDKSARGLRIRPFHRAKMERQFGEEMWDYITGVPGNYSQAVREQGDVFRRLADTIRADANQPMAYRQEFGRPVRGFGTVESDPLYVPREFDTENLYRLSREFGDPNLEELLAGAYRSNNPNVNRATALRAAQAYLRTVRSLRMGIGGDTARVLSSGDAEEIKRFLRDNAEDMAEADIEDVVDALTAKRGQGGVSHGKSRMDFDDNFTMPLKRDPTRGGGSRDVSIKEIFNRDVNDLFTKYNRRMSGQIALARTRIPGLADGITSRGEFDTLKNKIREIGDRVGQSPERLRKEMAELDFLYDAVAGNPIKAAGTTTGQALRQLREYNFARVGGQMGIAQIPEAGVIVTGTGLKAALQGMPGFRGLWRDMQTGRVGNELVDEIEVINGLGADWARLDMAHRYDDVMGANESRSGRFLDQVDTMGREAKKAVFAGSGMGPVNTALQRWSIGAITNRFANHALGQGRMMSQQRLRSIGLSDAKLERVMENIRNHAQFEDGLTGRKLRKLNFKDWDMNAAADFQEALFTYSRRMVQENDPGMMRAWMAHPLAQTILQFRSFIIGAHTKQLLHNIHMRDFQAFSMFMTTSMIGALGYMTYTYGQSIGRSDRARYLEERLSVDNVAKAAFERSSWASLMPTAIDTATHAIPGVDQQFAYMRSSGQATDALFGSPTTDLADSALQAVSSVTRPMVEGRAPAQEEIRSGLRALPFQNLHGIVQMTNVVLGESGLPEDAPR